MAAYGLAYQRGMAAAAAASITAASSENTKYHINRQRRHRRAYHQKITGNVSGWRKDKVAWRVAKHQKNIGGSENISFENGSMAA